MYAIEVQRLAIARNPGIDGGSGTWTAKEHDPLAAQFQQVLRDCVPGPAIVDSDQVILASGRIGTNISVQKDYRTTSIGADGDINYVILYSGGVPTTLGTINTPSNPSARQSHLTISDIRVHSCFLYKMQCMEK